jgi:hypothetical protein
MFEKMKFVMGRMWNFLAPFIRQMMTAAGPMLADAALKAVTEIEVSWQSSDGEEKRAMAFEKIKDDLAQQGFSLATSTIHAAIEAAVIHLKQR